jgi:uncharacterized membrane protein YoaK (UPF0700 family)
MRHLLTLGSPASHNAPVIRYGRPLRVFAICLSALAGYVDAVGFLALGAFFVSFMSGNSTRLSVGLASHHHDAAIAGGLIASFVSGVFLGSAAGRFARQRRTTAILILVSALLVAGATLAVAGLRPVALALVAMAMGAENNVFEREGEVSVGVTYMTGTLVKLGQRAAGAVFGEDPLGWLPYLLLWLGLVSGAFLGAAVYPWLGLQALWIAAVAALMLALITTRLDLTVE